MSQGFRGEGEAFPPIQVFTWADVDLLRDQADSAEALVARAQAELGVDDAEAAEEARDEIEALRGLADRIAAFLPARDG